MIPIGLLVAGGLAGSSILGLAGLRARDDRDARRRWARLAADPSPRRGTAFREETVASLPAPVRRYFAHAIAPGTALSAAVQLEMTGEIRLRPGAAWLPLRARQVLSPHRGFVWRATAGRGLRTFVGGDEYGEGRAAVRFWLGGVLPVVRAGGGSDARDVARSAIGRMAAEAVWVPAALLPSEGVRWTSPGGDAAVAAFSVDGQPVEVTLGLDPSGAVRRVRTRRWGNWTEDGRHAEIPFGAEVAGEARFGGYTIPARLSAAWWPGSERQFEFIRVAVRSASFS